MQKLGMILPFLSLLAAPAIASASTTLDPDLEKAFMEKPLQRVIVNMEDDFSGSAVNPVRLSPKEYTEKLNVRKKVYRENKDRLFNSLKKQGHSLKLHYEYDALPMVALDVTREQALAIANDTQVTAIIPDHKLYPAIAAAGDFVYAPDYNIYTDGGAGTGIVILDTPIQYWNEDLFPGCSTDKDFNKFQNDIEKCPIKMYRNMAKNVDLNKTIKDEKGNNIPLSEFSNHGTYVAATVHATASAANIIHLNIFHYDTEDKDLSALETDQQNALNWIINNIGAGGELEKYNILAVNISAGRPRTDHSSAPCDDSTYVAAKPIQMLYNNGIFTFVAAGNEGMNNSVDVPGCVSAAMTIGAQYHYDNGSWTCYKSEWEEESGKTYIQRASMGDLACFSNRNGMIDFIAPGVNLNFAKGTPSADIMSGTSFASPLAAAAYLLYQSFYYQYYTCRDDSEGPCFDQLFWAEQQLLTQAWPIYSFNSYYSQINLNDEVGPNWSMAYRLGKIYIATDENNNKIAKGKPLEYTIQVKPNDNIDIVEGLYLFIDTIVDNPSDISITVYAPAENGSSNRDTINFSLPKTATSNFKGIIGRTVYPGKFQSFNGKHAVGNWTVKFENNNSAASAYLLKGSIIFVNEGCTEDCENATCGDNLCAGKCGTECSDNIKCNGVESCRYGSCHAGSLDNPLCDDGDGLDCTNYCDEETGTCTGTKSSIIKGYCAINKQCYRDGDPEPGNACKSCQAYRGFQDTFTVDENATSCEDGNLCTVGDYCTQGRCNPGNDLDCNDDNPCTEESCDPLIGCQYTNIEAPCDDHNACTVDEHCVNGKCTGSMLVFCDDDNYCTDDKCDPETGKCVFTNNTNSCDDGNAMTIDDVCQEGVCKAGKTAKSGCSCNSANDPSAICGALFMLLSLIYLKKRKAE